VSGGDNNYTGKIDVFGHRQTSLSIKKSEMDEARLGRRLLWTKSMRDLCRCRGVGVKLQPGTFPFERQFVSTRSRSHFISIIIWLIKNIPLRARHAMIFFYLF
jgi:hypothetical protein